MLPAAHRRHDISDAVWKKLESHLPGREGSWGGIAHDNRRLINAVSGLCALARHGETCRRTSAGGAIRIGASSAGAAMASGTIA